MKFCCYKQNYVVKSPYGSFGYFYFHFASKVRKPTKKVYSLLRTHFKCHLVYEAFN